MRVLALTTAPSVSRSAGEKAAGPVRPRRRPVVTALPVELAFWALWHCRHARPPDALPH